MADAVIKHFRQFEEERVVKFGDRVRSVLAQVVYDVAPEDIEPLMVTIESRQMGLGSSSGSPSGTELEIWLDAEEWPVDEQGRRASVEESIEKCTDTAHAVGRLLMGGVDEVEGLAVPVWVNLAMSSGYDGY